MKKISFLLLFMVFVPCFASAQVIEDFDGITLVLDWFIEVNSNTSLTLIPNPLPGGINTSKYVMKFVKDKDEHWWLSVRGLLEAPVTGNRNLYLKAKIWQPRNNLTWFGVLSRFRFMENYGNTSIAINQWKDITSDLSYNPTPDPIIGQFDVIELGLTLAENLTEDYTMYFDDIQIFNSSAMDNASLIFSEDFETIPVNILAGGDEDSSSISLVPNPDLTGINVSSYVLKYKRDKDGTAASGFLCIPPEGLDITTNRYLHVKVWKPRVSPLRCRIEGGGAGELEVESLSPQSKIDAWEEIIFDLGGKTGIYPTFALMPDYEDPLTITQDEEMYFDDFILSDDPEPRGVTTQVINYDLNGFKIGSDDVYIGGLLSNTNFTWESIYGSRPENRMSDPDGDGIYSISLHLPDGPILPEFYCGTATGGYRTLGVNQGGYIVKGDAWLNHRYGGYGYYESDGNLYELTINLDMNGAELPTGEKVYISGNFPGIYQRWSEPGTNSNNELLDGDGDGIYSIAMQLPQGYYSFRFYKGTGWQGEEWKGWPDRSCVLTGNAEIEYEWGSKKSPEECNILKDEQFDNDKNVAPFEQSFQWTGKTPYGTADIVDGILTLKNCWIGEWRYHSVSQSGEASGWGLENDSSYFLLFDAWADRERVLSMVFEDDEKYSFNNYGVSPDKDAVNGKCRWDVQLSSLKTTYCRFVTFNDIQSDSRFNFRIDASADTGTVYVDNVYLIRESDINMLGLGVTGLQIVTEGNATSIDTDKGTLQLVAEVLPDSAIYKEVKWSVVNGSGTAMIDQSGLLTALTDGRVKVIATSLSNPSIKDSMDINLSNQVMLTYPIDFETDADFKYWQIIDYPNYQPGDFGYAKNLYTSVWKSDSVLKFTIKKEAARGAGAYSDAFEPIDFSQIKDTIYLMVKKLVNSPTGIRLEQSTNGGPDTEVFVTNTTTNNWEKLAFDFSSCNGYKYRRIVIIPDYSENRTLNYLPVYIDSIYFNLRNIGIDIKEADCNIRLFPNPVLNELNVTFATPIAVLEIYNSLGIKLQEFAVQGTTARIDVTNYPGGIYFLRINGSETIKFVKMVK